MTEDNSRFSWQGVGIGFAIALFIIGAYGFFQEKKDIYDFKLINKTIYEASYTMAYTQTQNQIVYFVNPNKNNSMEYITWKQLCGVGQ